MNIQHLANSKQYFQELTRTEDGKEKLNKEVEVYKKCLKNTNDNLTLMDRDVARFYDFKQKIFFHNPMGFIMGIDGTNVDLIRRDQLIDRIHNFSTALFPAEKANEIKDLMFFKAFGNRSSEDFLKNATPQESLDADGNICQFLNDLQQQPLQDENENQILKFLKYQLIQAEENLVQVENGLKKYNGVIPWPEDQTIDPILVRLKNKKYNNQSNEAIKNNLISVLEKIKNKEESIPFLIVLINNNLTDMLIDGEKDTLQIIYHTLKDYFYNVKLVADCKDRLAKAQKSYHEELEKLNPKAPVEKIEVNILAPVLEEVPAVEPFVNEELPPPLILIQKPDPQPLPLIPAEQNPEPLPLMNEQVDVIIKNEFKGIEQKINKNQENLNRITQDLKPKEFQQEKIDNPPEKPLNAEKKVAPKQVIEQKNHKKAEAPAKGFKRLLEIFCIPFVKIGNLIKSFWKKLFS